MKKGFLVTLLLAVFMAFVPAFAEEAEKTAQAHIWDHGDNVSSISYRNATIIKVLDAKGAYIVFYEMQGIKIGHIVVPKSWAKEEPRRLEFRNKPALLEPYMTVMYQNGEFYKIWITINPSRLDPVWGVAPRGTVVNLDIDTLDVQF